MLQLFILRTLESYFRHRWLYLAPIVLLTAAGVYYSSIQEPSYIVRATIYVQGESLINSLTALRNDSYSWVTPAAATRSEVEELLRSDAFMQAIVEQTSLAAEAQTEAESTSELLARTRDKLWAAELGSNLMMIGAAHTDPQIAQELVASTIDTYLQWKLNKDRADSEAAMIFFTELVDSYRSQYEPVRQSLTDYQTIHPEPVRGERPATEVAEIARLQSEVDTANARLVRAESKLEDARMVLTQAESEIRQTYFVVDSPALPSEPEQSLKKMLLTLLLFVAAGVAISITGVIGGTLLDNALRFPSDVHHALGLTVIALVPEKPELAADRQDAALVSAPPVAARPAAAEAAAYPPRRKPIFGQR